MSVSAQVTGACVSANRSLRHVTNKRKQASTALTQSAEPEPAAQPEGHGTAPASSSPSITTDPQAPGDPADAP